MRKLLTFAAVIFTFKIAINSAIECHSCRAVPQELCKKATDLPLTQCHEPGLKEKENGASAVCVKLVFKNGHINRYCGTTGHLGGSCENKNLTNYGVDICRTCREDLCNFSTRSEVNYKIFAIIISVISLRILIC